MNEYREMNYENMSPQMRRMRERQDFKQNEDGGYSLENFNTPPQDTFDTEEMRGSMQFILAKNIGQYVVVEFLIGTEQILRKQGMLFHVGRSYLTLYDEYNNNFIVCDIFSVKFVYFYMPGDRPRTNFNQLPGIPGPGSNNRR